MPNPMPGDVHVNSVLTNISVAYMQANANAFVADRVFPIVPVSKQSDRYIIFNRGDFARDEMKKRAPATESAGGGYRIDNTPTYYCDVWALHKDVDDQLRSNADAPLNMDVGATDYITQMMLIRKEKLWTNAFFKTGVWTGDQTGVAATPGANQFLQWNDPNSTPIESIRAMSLAMAARSMGFRPNVLVLGATAYSILLDHPDILERIKYTQRGILSADLLASMFEVDRVLIGYAVETTSAEGAASDTFAFINNSKGALLAYAEPNPGIMKPSAGYTFSWTGYLGAAPQGQRIKRFRMEELAADRVEGEIAMEQKVVSPDLGIFFASAVA